MSLLLFAVAMEPLAQALRQNAEIKGIQGAGEEHKVSLYADYLVNGPANRICKLFSHRFNIQKSELMTVGTSNSETSLNSLPFKISPKTFKYLSI